MNVTFEQTRFRGIAQKLPGAPTLPHRISINVPRAAVLHLLALALASISLAYVLFRFSSFLEMLGHWRYLGVAAAEFGNSAMMVFPTPASAYTFAMGAALNPLLVGLIGGAAATIGELIGYNIGKRGNSVISDRPSIQRFSAWTERWGTLILLVCAALPVPFDIAGVWAGATRYPLVRFIPVVLIGKTIRATSIALAGYFGLEAATGLIG
jgi:membrane protein DedA with SNARE-associated domain